MAENNIVSEDNNEYVNSSTLTNQIIQTRDYIIKTKTPQYAKKLQ
jgi:hypothetical protein